MAITPVRVSRLAATAVAGVIYGREAADADETPAVMPRSASPAAKCLSPRTGIPPGALDTPIEALEVFSPAS